MSDRFDAKVAVVTGAGRGLGSVVAGSLLQNGFTVLATDVDASALEEFSAAHKAFDAKLATRQVDVRERSALEECLTFATDTWGQVEVLVNNAAVTKTTPIFDISPEENFLKSWTSI